MTTERLRELLLKLTWTCDVLLEIAEAAENMIAVWNDCLDDDQWGEGEKWLRDSLARFKALP